MAFEQHLRGKTMMAKEGNITVLKNGNGFVVGTVRFR